MTYLVYVLCALITLWTAWLFIRWPMPHISGRIRVYRENADGFCMLIAVLLINGLFIWLSVLAAKAGAWFAWPVTLGAAITSCGVMSQSIVRSIVFSEEELAVRGLFGPLHTYRWADVTACTVHRESVHGRFAHDYDLYELTLPDRVIRISGAEDAGRELLQVFERCRPDLMAVRLPPKGQGH